MNQFKIDIKNEIILTLLNKDLHGRELSKQLNKALISL